MAREIQRNFRRAAENADPSEERTRGRRLDNRILAPYNSSKGECRMLDEKDLQAIAQLIDKKLDPIKEDIEELKAGQTKLKAEILHEAGALIEADVIPRFNLLADGQKLIREKMLPAEALDTVEDRVDVLEAVVKLHSREIEKLKKAQ